MPELYIIMGPNGAGKSSTGPGYLPDHIRDNFPVFDGDKLFMQSQRELWAQGIRAIKEARNRAMEIVEQTFDHLVETSLADESHFVYEGHFTNDATWDVPRRFKERGYTTNLFYLGLTNPELSELRVVDRTKEGGHYVDPLTIRNNFYGNLEKLNQHYELFNSIKIIDTSSIDHRILAQFSGDNVEYAVALNEIPSWVTDYLPRLADLIFAAE